MCNEGGDNRTVGAWTFTIVTYSLGTYYAADEAFHSIPPHMLPFQYSRPFSDTYPEGTVASSKVADDYLPWLP